MNIYLTILYCILLIINIVLFVYNGFKYLEYRQTKDALENSKKLCTALAEREKELQCSLGELTQDIQSQIKISQTYDKDIELLEEQTNELTIEYKKKLDESIKIQQEISSYKNFFQGLVKSKIREEEKEQDNSFYKLSITKKDLADIQKIKEIEEYLSNPRPVRMLIWQTFYSKGANDLASRVLKKAKVTGIYKLTDTITGKSYVGQAVDVKERWREHMKYGLGIDTPATNSLYQAMLKDGIYNFTFELLEECPREELNDKERMYIDIYQTYEYGYNGNKGIKNGSKK